MSPFKGTTLDSSPAAAWAVGLLACALISSASAEARSESAQAIRGAVAMVTLPNGNLQLAVDLFDEHGIADGLADHLFILERDQPAGVPDLFLPSAMVVYTDRKLTLKLAEQEILWRLPEAESAVAVDQKTRQRTILFGTAYSHFHGGDFGMAAEVLAAQDYRGGQIEPSIIPDGGGGAQCDSGGIGAIACEVGGCNGSPSSCGIICLSSSRYACCKCGSGGGRAYCDCFKIPTGGSPPGGG